MLTDFINGIFGGSLLDFLNVFFGILPNSSNLDFGLSSITSLASDSVVSTGLSWLNWFVPVSSLAAIVAAWAACMAIYHVLHWIYLAVVDWK